MQDLQVQKIYFFFFLTGNKYQMQKQILVFVQCEADPFTCQKVKKKKRPMWIMTVTFNDLSHSKSKQTQYEMFSYQVISVMY